MTNGLRIFIGFSLTLLMLSLFFGAFSAFSFLYPEAFNSTFPFYQLRPMHVSAALFWIISGGVAGILYYKKEVFLVKETRIERWFMGLWMTTILAIFVFYAFRKFGGREYWEFPPFLCIPILVAWLSLMHGYYTGWQRRGKQPPLYVWQWTTGIVFFLITFLEQNLYQIPWFRESFLREMTVQWKSNGAMVGAWNQMIYGTSLFIMTRIAKDDSIATSKTAYAFYFIGLGNLMLNWGHHIYNLPAASFIRHTAYAVSMTEWVIFIAICMDFKRKLSEARRFQHLVTHRFLMYAEFWVYLNLFLALLMSVPAVNRYTHGTHITVAHAMGATIGINTMILLGALSHMLRVDALPERNKRMLSAGFLLAKISLLVFWAALLVAGFLKGYRDVALGITNFQEMMQPIWPALRVFAFSGILLLIGMLIVVIQFFVALRRKEDNIAYPNFDLVTVKADACKMLRSSKVEAETKPATPWKKHPNP